MINYYNMTKKSSNELIELISKLKLVYEIFNISKSGMYYFNKNNK